jgi:hypothetical protein
MNHRTPLIAELPVEAAPVGRSRLVLFLDADTANTEGGNAITQDFFENCYAYEDYLEDVQHRSALLDRIAALEEALAQQGKAA